MSNWMELILKSLSILMNTFIRCINYVCLNEKGNYNTIHWLIMYCILGVGSYGSVINVYGESGWYFDNINTVRSCSTVRQRNCFICSAAPLCVFSIYALYETFQKKKPTQEQRQQNLQYKSQEFNFWIKVAYNHMMRTEENSIE